ncbi:MAG: hypothetical protein QM702_21155 [Rubrivivax sp.]
MALIGGVLPAFDFSAAVFGFGLGAGLLALPAFPPSVLPAGLAGGSVLDEEEEQAATTSAADTTTATRESMNLLGFRPLGPGAPR